MNAEYLCVCLSYQQNIKELKSMEQTVRVPAGYPYEGMVFIVFSGCEGGTFKHMVVNPAEADEIMEQFTSEGTMQISYPVPKIIKPLFMAKAPCVQALVVIPKHLSWAINPSAE
jgi:hypothetical protein